MDGPVGTFLDRALVVLDSQDTALAGLRQLLAGRRVSAPVLGESGRLVGVVQLAALLSAQSQDTVAHHTTLGLCSCDCAVSLSSVREELRALRHPHLLVTRNGHPIGFLDGLDLARHAVVTPGAAA